MIKVTSFYKFFPIEKNRLKNYRRELLEKAKNSNIRGLALIAEEGINATFCGKEKDLENYKNKISGLFGEKFFWKDSHCEKWNFKLLSIKIKKEIINTGKDYLLLEANNSSLSPQKWEEKLKNQAQVLDIRNNYEVELGRFKGAKDLNMDTFQELSDKLEGLDMDKSKETLIYCTGGIRCEKAIEIMKNKGFQKVYQLKGGILNYLKKFPHSYFEKECFVFDHRVAVDQNLQATKKYSLCPHCGQPGDLHIVCKHCKKPAVICRYCQNQLTHFKTCSKNCAYHFEKGHKCRNPKPTQKALLSH